MQAVGWYANIAPYTMSASNLFLRQRLATCHANLTEASHRLARVNTLADLKLARQVSIPAELRAVIRSDSTYRRFAGLCTQKAQELGKDLLIPLSQLVQVQGEPADVFLARSTAEAGKVIRTLGFLAGDEPQVHAQLLREVARLQSQHRKHAAA